jgi:ParB-like chromosome segregation protein Spo0J
MSEQEDVPAPVADEQFATDVQVWSIEEVHPYVNNPKEHPEEQVAKIRSSIKNYGFDQPIVVDENGEIIKGHGRRLAAQSLGLEEVPVLVRADLTEAEKRASRIADNRTSQSDWSVDELASEFEQIQEAEEDLGLDVTEATAFEEDEVEDFFERQSRPDEDEWLDHFDEDKMAPDASEDSEEDKKHITLLLPESRHEQLMGHLDEYEGGRDESFIQWMDDTLGEPEAEEEEEEEQSTDLAEEAAAEIPDGEAAVPGDAAALPEGMSGGSGPAQEAPPRDH